MTKEILIDPAQVRQASKINSNEIPINTYVTDPIKESKKYGPGNLIRMYRDMVLSLIHI